MNNIKKKQIYKLILIINTLIILHLKLISQILK